jgi:ApbE superfamily uncharacterized protein (UPF0280 family)
MTDACTSFKRRRKFNESNVFFQNDILDALDRAEAAIRLSRIELESYILLRPGFVHALRPVTVNDSAPEVEMMAFIRGGLSVRGAWVALDQYSK